MQKRYFSRLAQFHLSHIIFSIFKCVSQCTYMMFRPMPGKFKEAKQVYMCGRRQVYLDRYRPIMVCLQGQCHEMFYPTPQHNITPDCLAEVFANMASISRRYSNRKFKLFSPRCTFFGLSEYLGEFQTIFEKILQRMNNGLIWAGIIKLGVKIS